MLSIAFGKLRVFICVAVVSALPCAGYSVLSHEAIIDALWDTGLRQALLKRFPSATKEQLKEAHSYAYGGAIMQDMGYYPHGNGYFSDLTHYARTSDLILALLADSQTLDEYAFALGALSHYAADGEGHRIGTNVAEPELYPKLRKRFGDVVTYEDAPYRHLQTEYAFDVEEVAKGNYAPEAYHDFIGFNVAASLLERAFRETYGFEIQQMVPDFDKAIGSYRHTLSTLIPFFTRVAWADHQSDIKKAQPGATRRRFIFAMSRSSYEHYWGKQYDRPSFLDRIIAFIVKLLPPLGEVRVLKFRAMTADTETVMMKSFDAAVPRYRQQLEAASAESLQLQNINFDVGVVTRPGQYKLQDETYAYWLDQLTRNNFSQLTPAIAHEVLSYYSDPNAPIATKKIQKEWQRAEVELQMLKAAASRLQ